MPSINAYPAARPRFFFTEVMLEEGRVQSNSECRYNIYPPRVSEERHHALALGTNAEDAAQAGHPHPWAQMMRNSLERESL